MELFPRLSYHPHTNHIFHLLSFSLPYHFLTPLSPVYSGEGGGYEARPSTEQPLPLFPSSYPSPLRLHLLSPITSIFLPLFLTCFPGLAVVVQAEAMELVPLLNNPEMVAKDDATGTPNASTTSNNKFLTGLLWEFCHTILLQFSLEELSQVSNISLHLYAVVPLSLLL